MNYQMKNPLKSEEDIFKTSKGEMMKYVFEELVDIRLDNVEVHGFNEVDSDEMSWNEVEELLGGEVHENNSEW